jgi:cation transport regulator ChaC
MTLPGGSWISAVYVTPDSKDQVVSFYKSRLGSELSVYDSADSAVLTAQKSKQEAVIVTVTANKSEYQGKTQITIVHTISTKAN